MWSKITTFFLILGLSVAASNGFAANTIAAIDTNGDGIISRSEWRLGSDSFRRYDRNGDGILTQRELLNLQARAEQEVYTIPSDYPTYNSGDYDQEDYPYQPTYGYNPAYSNNPNVYGAYNPYPYNNSNAFIPGYGYGDNPLGYGNGGYVSKKALQTQAGINLVGALVNTIMTLR